MERDPREPVVAAAARSETSEPEDAISHAVAGNDARGEGPEPYVAEMDNGGVG